MLNVGGFEQGSEVIGGAVLGRSPGFSVQEGARARARARSRRPSEETVRKLGGETPNCE